MKNDAREEKAASWSNTPLASPPAPAGRTDYDGMIRKEEVGALLKPLKPA